MKRLLKNSRSPVLSIVVMSLPFPSLRELSMRKVLLEELPWQEGLEGLPMKKELEALDRLPGKYTVIKTSREVIKDGTLRQGEARGADKLAGKGSFKKGGKVSISKEMRGDPVVLWRIDDGKESGKFSFHIMQSVQHDSELSRDGKIVSMKITNHISGVKVEREANYTGKVEMKICYTCEGKMVDNDIDSYCFMVDGKGKLEVTLKRWKRFKSGGEVELIDTAVAQRD